MEGFWSQYELAVKKAKERTKIFIWWNWITANKSQKPKNIVKSSFGKQKHVWPWYFFENFDEHNVLQLLRISGQRMCAFGMRTHIL